MEPFERYCIGVLIFFTILLIILSHAAKQADKEYEQDYLNHLLTAEDIVNKQITTNTTYETKINIIRSSCDFVFGKSYQYNRCTEDILKSIEPANVIHK